jgi:hypothetical protein
MNFWHGPWAGTARRPPCPCRHDTRPSAVFGPPAWPMARHGHEPNDPADTGRRGAQPTSPAASADRIYKRRLLARVPRPSLPSRLAAPHRIPGSRLSIRQLSPPGSLTLSSLPAPALLRCPHRSFPSRLWPPSPLCPNLLSHSDASSSSRSRFTPVPSRSVAAWILELAAGPTPVTSLLSLPPPASLSPLSSLRLRHGPWAARHGYSARVPCRGLMAWPIARPGTATRGGTEECRASTARPCRVPCCAGTTPHI